MLFSMNSTTLSVNVCKYIGMPEYDSPVIADEVCDHEKKSSDISSVGEPEYWESVTDEELDNEFEAGPQIGSPGESATDSELAAKNLVHLTLVFILLWASHYGVSSNAVGHLIQYIHHFFASLSPFVIANILAYFPSSLYMLRKHFGLQKDRFIKFTICPACNSLYKYENSYTFDQASKVCRSKTCSHVEFPKHPHPSRRKPCGHLLLKEVVLSNGKRKLYPKKVYCYRNLKDSLQEIMGREGMFKLCEEWRQRNVPEQHLGDIYDGRVWKEFYEYHEKPFLSKPHNLALMLNCDWFQPYKLTEYSVGVLYMVILNLPRAVRFKAENIIIVGIIPGPNEPSENVNSYIWPLVDELLGLWRKGMEIGDKTVHAALLCVACDLPAAHKVCGFLSHSSHHACSRCKKFFPFNEELRKIMYSGFTESHPSRMQSDHKAAGIKWLSATTASARNEVEKSYGSRFTKLNLLPYFNCIQFTIIDPMHNLFLGTAKHVMKNVWIQDNLIQQAQFERIHSIVQDTLVPSSVGRIPHKILSGFSAFTADQWKNWCLIYSLVALNGILPSADLECWRIFVQMCILLCTPLISLNNVTEVGNLAIKFGKMFESLYGKHRVTPNMHLHVHIKECILDYGPVYGFWLYSFERFNGLLGNYDTNQKSIEIQVMRKFLDDMHVRSIASADCLVYDNMDLFEPFFANNKVGSCADTIVNIDRQTGSAWHPLLTLSTDRVQPTVLYTCTSFMSVLPPFKRRLFDCDSLRYLKEAYSCFLPVDLEEIPASYEMYTTVILWGMRIGSKNSRHERSSVVQAYWAGRDGCIAKENGCLCSGRVEYYFRQNVFIGEKRENIVMALVQWFRHHPRNPCLVHR